VPSTVGSTAVSGTPRGVERTTWLDRGYTVAIGTPFWHLKTKWLISAPRARPSWVGHVRAPCFLWVVLLWWGGAERACPRSYRTAGAVPEVAPGFLSRRTQRGGTRQGGHGNASAAPPVAPGSARATRKVRHVTHGPPQTTPLGGWPPQVSTTAMKARRWSHTHTSRSPHRESSKEPNHAHTNAAKQRGRELGRAAGRPKRKERGGREAGPIGKPRRCPQK
jgi:hypothetical protein